MLAQGRLAGLSGNAVEDLAGRLKEASGSEPNPHEINTLMALFSEARFTEAAILAQTLTVRFPFNGFGWNVLGTVLKQLGRSADALASMQKAAALSPHDANVHSNLGVIFLDLGKSSEAETSFRRALEIEPDYAEAHSNLGNALKDLGRLDEAVASYRQALQINPDFAEAHNNLGTALRELGQLDDAVTSYHLALGNQTR
ncbi:MAG: tetratricopeptide repeat protein [Nitrosomonadales bacterium]